MSRMAECCCGSLRAEVSGDPILVGACHCEQCQRRTGSPFGVSAYFPADQVRVSGSSKVFTRDGQDGRRVRMGFCPDCGSTVFWEADFLPGHVAIAVGAFCDPAFPPPSFSIWERTKHPWVTLAAELQRRLDQDAPK
ncbi:GFA family protein [Arenibaculum pallidiluteum]|uniref:GFA family protein n=1 Tax=Arenibaculum pallidiluteum TaxID=2812559 RepID=UPI001A96AD85